MNRTVIVRPSCASGYCSSIQSLRAKEAPIWHAILANYYKAMAIVDGEAYDWDSKELASTIAMYEPDRVIILPTGSHPSAYIQQKEDALEVAKELEQYLIKKVEILDSLPVSPIGWGLPRWDLLDMKKYKAHNWHCWGGLDRNNYASVFTSISCKFNCSFCTIKQFYGNTYQCATLEEIEEQFKALAKLGIKNIKIMDELFVYNKERVKLICDIINKIGFKFNIWCYGRIDTTDTDMLLAMKKAGINWISYGIESGNEEIRKKVSKGNFTNWKIQDIVRKTKDIGINVLGNYMFGFWDDTLVTMQETLDLAKELNCEYSNFYCVVAYPNGSLEDESLRQYIPTKPSEYSQMNPNFKNLPTKWCTAKEVLEFRDRAFTEYHTNPLYLRMMHEKFGDNVYEELKNMTNKRITRNG